MRHQFVALSIVDFLRVVMCKWKCSMDPSLWKVDGRPCATRVLFGSENSDQQGPGFNATLRTSTLKTRFDLVDPPVVVLFVQRGTHDGFAVCADVDEAVD